MHEGQGSRPGAGARGPTRRHEGGLHDVPQELGGLRGDARQQELLVSVGGRGGERGRERAVAEAEPASAPGQLPAQDLAEQDDERHLWVSG